MTEQKYIEGHLPAGVLVLHEIVTWIGVVGILLVISGMVLGTRQGKRLRQMLHRDVSAPAHNAGALLENTGKIAEAGFYRCSSFSRRKLRPASSRPRIASTSAAAPSRYVAVSTAPLSHR